jgi:IS5 family transposase
MNELMPWNQLEAVIEPFSSKTSNGKRYYPLLAMLRIYPQYAILVQHE